MWKCSTAPKTSLIQLLKETRISHPKICFWHKNSVELKAVKKEQMPEGWSDSSFPTWKHKINPMWKLPPVPGGGKTVSLLEREARLRDSAETDLVKLTQSSWGLLCKLLALVQIPCVLSILRKCVVSLPKCRKSFCSSHFGSSFSWEDTCVHVEILVKLVGSSSALMSSASLIFRPSQRP